jgi:hypothetical protein
VDDEFAADLLRELQLFGAPARLSILLEQLFDAAVIVLEQRNRVFGPRGGLALLG